MTGTHPPRRDAAPGRPPGPGRGDREQLLTVEEVLHQLRIPRSTWYQWRQTGKAPKVIKLPNGQLRIRRTALAEWLQAREDPAS